MNVSDAIRVVVKESRFQAGEPDHPGERYASRSVPSLAKKIPEGPPPTVILPFGPVLLLGRDAPWSEADDGTRSHPSVGYARVIYLVVLLNWVIDVIGFAYLFHTFLVWHPSQVVHTFIPVVMGMTFSSGLAALAVSLVQKPLRKPRWPRLPVWAYGLGACLVVPSAYLALSANEFVPALLEPAVWLVLGVTPILAMARAFGAMEAVFVASRGAMMLVVGYVVAGPIHQAMFQKEIEERYYALGEEQVENLKKEETKSYNALVEICDKTGGVAPNGVVWAKGDCASEKAELDTRDAYLQHAKIVNDKVSGWRNRASDDNVVVKGKKWLNDQVDKVDLAYRDVYAIGDARRSSKIIQAAEANFNTAKKKQEDAAKAFELCSTGAMETAKSCKKGPSEAHTGNMARLDKRLNEYKNHTNKPGAIDRALALNHIAHDAAEMGGDRGEDALAVVDQLFDTAWVVALLLPLAVLIMKITAGARLEPYLERRWKLAEVERK